VEFDHRISLQKLEILCLVLELGGVRQAAERLFVSQPVVSAHLKSLESYVGAKLFYKAGRRLALTEAGVAVHTWARSVLGEQRSLERHIEEIAAGDAGAVSVAASMTVGSHLLPPVLFEFKVAHPSAQVRLLVSDPETALRRVETGVCEFGVIMTDAPIDPEIFVAEMVRRDEYVLIAAPGSDLPDRIPVSRLAELPAVCPPAESAVRRMQDAELRAAGVPGRPIAMELGSGEAMKGAVLAGLGVALISHLAVDAEIERGEFRRIEIEGATLTHAMTLVRRRRTQLSPLQQRLIDMIRETDSQRSMRMS
jgi:DNA-binding transcriptional LysR family regulator